MTMFRPSLVGGALCTIITQVAATVCSVLMINEYEYRHQTGEKSSGNPISSSIPLLMLFLAPAIYTVSYAWSGRDKDNHTSLLKAYGIFFAALMLETVFIFIYGLVILPYFFLASTSTFTRFLIRMLAQIFVLKVGLELSWRWSKHAAEHMDAKITDATVASLGFYVSAVPVLGRIMQGSAETVGESILYEIAGTLSELWMADQLLRSRTPIFHYTTMLRYYINAAFAKKTKVVPASSGRPLTGMESLRKSLCETAMIMITISEAAGLLASSAFWLVMDANPSEPGSPKIPVAQTLKTFAIMLIGELVVTDGIVAYVSNKFKKRYIVDLAAAWHDHVTNRKKLLLAFVAIISMASISTIISLPINMCYTSLADDEANFALTSCPDVPKNITEMSRVSLGYQEVWDKYNRDFEPAEIDWEGLVGMNADAACELLKELKPDFSIIPVHEDAAVTEDYRLDRIRVYYDDDGLVSKIPVVG
mmetsp:Transcript_30093/g.59771  ORF Transcript_30093/g.59771 Transcript_30093/m.59771 type:complete len:477 (+) Transcript_30093:633-2063(+)